uniref:Ground-like domain-containing protein n=1 Tax=Steinernema glaseri TaxID=37863 RepID=A0A1I7ZUT7_9BILA
MRNLLVALCLFVVVKAEGTESGGYQPNGAAPTYQAATAAPIDAKVVDNYGVSNDFPLPGCYLNDAGYLCCNKEQEMVMHKAYDNITSSRGGKFKKCNIHQISVKLQEDLQNHFKADFEAVTAVGDFASKNYFSQDYICKIKRDDMYMLGFGTPQRVKPSPEKYADRPPQFVLNTFV